MLKYQWLRKTLRFKFDAGTSRGVYRTHDVWYVFALDPDGKVAGIGEAAPLEGLSREFEDAAQYESLIEETLAPANKATKSRYRTSTTSPPCFSDWKPPCSRATSAPSGSSTIPLPVVRRQSR